VDPLLFPRPTLTGILSWEGARAFRHVEALPGLACSVLAQCRPHSSAAVPDFPGTENPPRL